MKKLLLIFLFLFLFVSPVQAQDRGWLFIPDLGLSTSIGTIPIIDNEYDMETVGQGVGWLEQTAWVDDTWARIVLGSHSTGAFSELNELEVGSWIYSSPARENPRLKVGDESARLFLLFVLTYAILST